MTVSFKKYLSALEETNVEFPKEKAKDIERDVRFEKVSLVINYKETKFDGFISDFFYNGKTDNTYCTVIFKTVNVMLC